MSSSSKYLRFFFSALLFTSNVLGVLHLHKFYPHEDTAQNIVDLSDHVSLDQLDVTCPLHFISQGTESISVPHVPELIPEKVFYLIPDYQIEDDTPPSSKSSRAPPFFV